MTGNRNAALGRYGEDVAARHLTSLGMTVLDRNWRCAAGEVDLVLRDGGVLVVCEVKTRIDVEHGHPLEAVTTGKLERLRRLADLWVEAHPASCAPRVPGHPPEMRIDLVGVLRPRRGPAVVEHVAGV